MRLGALRATGLAFVCLAFASCAPTRDFISSSHLWPWKQGQGAPGLTADLSKPFPRVGRPPDAQPEMRAARPPAEFDADHPLVQEYVRRFQNEWRGFYGRALERSTRYVPRMAEILEREGVPREIAYLPLIESGFVTHAVSRAGAVGPWQFIRPTGRRYGLRIDYYVDERRDPVKSTEAAARYLKDLYAMFGDWNLSLAAYNTGEGNISRILEKKDAKDYWDMVGRGYLHRETEQYVPRFLAAVQIAREPEAYGFELPDEVEDAMAYDWVHVSHALPLSKIAELAGTSKDAIVQLNPALRRGVVPGSGYAIKLPKGTKRQYQLAAAKIDPRLYAWNPNSAQCQSDEGRHCVRRGDTIGTIAQRYGVSAEKLMRENGISNPRTLQVGKALYIPGQHKSRPSRQVASNSGGGTHVVRAGDTLGEIAEQYGTSAKALMSANGIRNPRTIRVGQKLRVPGTAVVASTASTKPEARTAKATASTQHVLRSGETVGALARRYGVSSQAILDANGIRDPRGLQIGRTLKIPGTAAAPVVAKSAPAPERRTSGATHVLAKGETIGALAARYGVSSQAILTANSIDNPRSLRVGRKLTIPSANAPRPAAQAVASAPAKTQRTTHRLRSGETLGGIAQRYGVSTNDLMRANGITNPRSVRAGRNLVIPGASGTTRTAAAASRTHKVRSGDSPYSIARHYRITVAELLKANGIRDPRGLRPGQLLVIPDGDDQIASR